MNLPPAFPMPRRFSLLTPPDKRKTPEAKALFSGRGHVGAQVIQKSNVFNPSVRADLYAHLTSKEFQPLQQVVTVLIINATRKVIFEPVLAVFRYAKDWSGLSAFSKKVKKQAEAKGEERVKNILPNVSLGPEKPNP